MAKTGAPSKVADKGGVPDRRVPGGCWSTPPSRPSRPRATRGPAPGPSPSGPGPTRASSSTTSARWPISCWPPWTRSAPTGWSGTAPAVARSTPRAELVDVGRRHLPRGPRRRLRHRAGRDDRRGLLHPRARRRGGRPDRAVVRLRPGAPSSALWWTPRSARSLPSADVAYGVVALYLGLEMLSHLDGDRAARLGPVRPRQTARRPVRGA